MWGVLFHVCWLLFIAQPWDSASGACFGSTRRLKGKWLCCINLPFEKLRKLEASFFFLRSWRHIPLFKWHSWLFKQAAKLAAGRFNIFLLTLEGARAGLLSICFLPLDNGLSERLQCRPLCISGNAGFWLGGLTADLCCGESWPWFLMQGNKKGLALRPCVKVDQVVLGNSDSWSWNSQASWRLKLTTLCSSPFAAKGFPIIFRGFAGLSYTYQNCSLIFDIFF